MFLLSFWFCMKLSQENAMEEHVLLRALSWEMRDVAQKCTA